MNEAKHTPAPWVEADGEIVHDAMTLALVYGADDFPCLDEDEDVKVIAAECKANAVLIAAAPDLLAACEAAYSALRSYQYGNSAPDLAQEVAASIRTVIAKAKGETS